MPLVRHPKWRRAKERAQQKALANRTTQWDHLFRNPVKDWGRLCSYCEGLVETQSTQARCLSCGKVQPEGGPMMYGKPRVTSSTVSSTSPPKKRKQPKVVDVSSRLGGPWPL
jgi:hypothetical protein